MTDCTACRLAETDPASPMFADGCRACHVRRVALSSTVQREHAYSQIAPDELAGFVADVWLAMGRLHGALASETTFTRAGSDG